jgi:lysophospholipase I
VNSLSASHPHRFDILAFGFNATEDEKGMRETVVSINNLISTELSTTDIDAGRIIVGGFSQGGAMSLLVGLTGERKLGGVTVLSGWLPLKGKFKTVS